jgi:hypothetical protein
MWELLQEVASQMNITLYSFTLDLIPLSSKLEIIEDRIDRFERVFLRVKFQPQSTHAILFAIIINTRRSGMKCPLCFKYAI